MIYVTSDTHFYHKNIVRKLSSWGDGSTMRDFDSVDHMNETIIDNINKRVKVDDHLICLGDWSFGNVKNIKTARDKINCKSIDLIFGNHDGSHGKDMNPTVDLIVTNNNNKWIKASDLFSFYGHYKEFSYTNTDGSKNFFCCFHYPISSWNHMGSGSIHLFGHCHSLPENKFFNGGKSMDVGLDGNNMEVYSIEEIIEIMKDKSPKREGHH
jgi:calcineurin-like phosphoesterase family protein